MSKIIKIGDKEYETEKLSNSAREKVAALQFANSRITELNNLLNVMARAKASYFRGIKGELYADKAGFIVDSD